MFPTTTISGRVGTASYVEINEFSSDDHYLYRSKPECCCGLKCGTLHCSPNDRILYQYNAAGHSPFNKTTFNDTSFVTFPISTANRVIIPLKSHGCEMEPNFINIPPVELVGRGIDPETWKKWSDMMKKEVSDVLSPLSGLCLNFMTLSVVLWPYCCYRLIRDSQVQGQLKLAFMKKFNAEVFEPRGMFAKICTSHYNSGGGENSTTATIWWLTIAMTPEHVRALKLENDCTFYASQRFHQENADGHCVTGLCELYCY